jgi:WD40 repeat protein
MKKGLVPQDLMTLKRIPNLAQLYGDTMEGVSREASGLGFDFPINDGTQYFTGTEDGLIHKCSVSYNEQTLENFYGHTGPVYKVCCSPFNADAFISCGADWTLNLWSQKKTKPVLTMQSGNDYVLDVQWSPSNSCVFGCVTRDGRIEIWDLEHSGLDPVVSLDVPNKELVSVSFCPELPVIVAGSTDGHVDVYRIHGVDLTGCHEKWDALQQEARIAEILYANIKHDDGQVAAADSEKKSSD